MLYPLSYEGGTSAGTSARRSEFQSSLSLRPLRFSPHPSEQINNGPFAGQTNWHHSKKSQPWRTLGECRVEACGHSDSYESSGAQNRESSTDTQFFPKETPPS
jgi:hypothetical protein